MKNIFKNRDFLIPFSLCIFLTFLLFYGLDLRTFRLWDESRLGVNAINVIISKNYFYTSYKNSPDFWNTKPHLLVLLQVLAMKIFGITEGSVRLPSALATLLSCSFVYCWIRKENYASLFACLGVLCFICTRFLSYHGARAGDYEALLILFEIIYCYAFFYFIKTQKSYYLLLGFLALTGAVLTKSIAGFLFIPGICIFILLKNRINLFLKAWFFYLGIIIFLACIASYYSAHELATPGYLQSVYNNEIMQRYFHQANGQTDEAWWFYLKSYSLIFFYFSPLFLICALYLIFHHKLFRSDLFLQYIIILVLSFFIVISSSKTKLSWYSYPLYPFSGIFIGNQKQ